MIKNLIRFIARYFRCGRSEDPKPNPINCPACGDLMIEDGKPFIGGFLRVCYECGEPWSIECRDQKTITVEPWEPRDDPMVEDIIQYNYDLGRRKRGYDNFPEEYRAYLDSRIGAM